MPLPGVRIREWDDLQTCLELKPSMLLFTKTHPFMLHRGYLYTLMCEAQTHTVVLATFLSITLNNHTHIILEPYKPDNTFSEVALGKKKKKKNSTS